MLQLAMALELRALLQTFCNLCGSLFTPVTWLRSQLAPRPRTRDLQEPGRLLRVVS
jgi:hypothetical protein